jgi:hypothetical protein
VKRRSASIRTVPSGRSSATSPRRVRVRTRLSSGPWLSEVGYEVLYWVPFVRWVQAQFRIPASRLVVVTRGGPPPGTRIITTNAVELFDLMSPDDYASRNAQRSAEDRGHA